MYKIYYRYSKYVAAFVCTMTWEDKNCQLFIGLLSDHIVSLCLREDDEEIHVKMCGLH